MKTCQGESKRIESLHFSLGKWQPTCFWPVIYNIFICICNMYCHFLISLLWFRDFIIYEVWKKGKWEVLWVKLFHLINMVCISTTRIHTSRVLKEMDRTLCLPLNSFVMLLSLDKLLNFFWYFIYFVFLLHRTSRVHIPYMQLHG